MGCLNKKQKVWFIIIASIISSAIAILTLEAINGIGEYIRQQEIKKELDRQEKSDVMKAIINYCNAEANK